MSIEMEKGDCYQSQSHNLGGGILFQSKSIFLNGQGYQTSHIPTWKPTLYLGFFLPKKTRAHASSISVTIIESLVIIRWKD